MNVSAEVCCEHVESRDVRKPLQGLNGAKNEFDKEFDTKGCGTSCPVEA